MTLEMFELGAPSLVMARRFQTQKHYFAKKSFTFLELSSFLELWVKEENLMAVQITNAFGTNT